MKAITCCCMMFVCMLVGTAHAQSRTSQPIEFGADAAFARDWVHAPNGGLFNPTTWNLVVPVQAIRVAFPLDDRLAIEPTLTLVKVGGDFSSTELTLDGALLYELSTDRSRPQWFLRPFIGVNHESTTNVTAGGGVGIKLPATDRIAARLEARYTYTSFGDRGSNDELGLFAGVSVYTR